MKKIVPFVALAIAILTACNPEELLGSNTPISVSNEISVPGLESWKHLVYVFDRTVCKKIYVCDDASQLPQKVAAEKGDEIVVVALESEDNLVIQPLEAGRSRYEYKIGVEDTSRPIPAIWSGSSKYKEGGVELALSEFTARVEISGVNLGDDIDYIEVSLPGLADQFFVSGQSVEYTADAVIVRIHPSELPATVNYFPMSCGHEPFEMPVSLFYKDRYSSAKISVGSGFSFSDNVKAVIDMSKDDNFTIGKIHLSLNGAEGRAYNLPMWDHPKEKITDFTKTEFPMHSGRNMAFIWGSGGAWNDSDLYSDNFRYWDGLARIDFSKACGFDFFRIPIDEDGLWHPDGTFREHGLKLLHEIVDECIAKEMRVILDLHWLHISNHFPNAESEMHYINCWRTLSEEFRDYPNEWVAYELLNEAQHETDWNGFIANSIDMLRSWGEKNRVIVCSVANYSDASGATGFDLPKGDPNLILTFHTYYHTYFTFYGTGHGGAWGNYNGPVHYPGRFVTDAEIANLSDYQLSCCDQWFLSMSSYKGDLRHEMIKPIEKARELGVPVFVGEYGCCEKCPLEDRKRWFRDKCDLFNELGASYSIWFGFGDYENDPMPNPDLIKSITGKDIEGKFYWGPSGVEWHED